MSTGSPRAATVSLDTGLTAGREQGCRAVIENAIEDLAGAPRYWTKTDRISGHGVIGRIKAVASVLAMAAADSWRRFHSPIAIQIVFIPWTRAISCLTTHYSLQPSPWSRPAHHIKERVQTAAQYATHGCHPE
ncbi:hypothetical protein J1614_000651 [Plenodomus biglobosus]|nr:hypothetical protein J1614_000651 [Plenodomus biglobosus]